MKTHSNIEKHDNISLVEKILITNEKLIYTLIMESKIHIIHRKESWEGGGGGEREKAFHYITK